ncbi:MAG: hypothetical protein M1820_002419 [Bogoriella megaspora]|nr:MAG: hypothetical protein M1820_002419 [Bogoriella megaspora]
MVKFHRVATVPYLACALIIPGVLGQSNSDDSSSIQSSSRASRTASSASASTTGSSDDNSGLISSLWAGGESLLTSVYPSTSIGNIATLTWPSSVVIGSSTVSVPYAGKPTSTSSRSATSPRSSISSRPSSSSSSHSSSSSSSSSSSITSHDAQPSQTDSPADSPSANKSNDHNKILGIVLGVVLGVLLLALLACLFLVLRRRRARRGAIFGARYETPVAESEIESWRQPSAPNYMIPYPDKYRGTSTHSIPRKPVPSTYQNDQAMRHLEGVEPIANVASHDNPFYTPEERQNLRSSGDVFNEHARVPHNFSDPDRPPTPFASVLFNNASRNANPPQKSPYRSSQAAIHYPSNSEASDFDFGFAARQKEQGYRDSNDSFYSASAEGWEQQQIHPAFRT